jgi:hypothetical protein
MYKKSLPLNCVFPEFHCEKEKVWEKGFVIAGIPL